MNDENQQFVDTVHKWRDKSVIEQTKEQIKADGINEFVTHMIAALEAGFIDTNKATLAEIHKVMQNFCLDAYGVKLPTLTEQWGEDTAKLCGFPLTAEAKEFCVVAGKFEQFGERNYKYSSEQFTLDEALEDLQKYQNYPFAHIEYKGWEIEAVKKDDQ